MENFVYMDETAIRDDYRCDVCSKPLINAVCFPSPCVKKFCSKCLDQKSISAHRDSCQACSSRNLSEEDLQVQGEFFNLIINRLPLQCLLCGETNIPRANHLQHSQDLCPRRKVSCQASNIQCPWVDCYDQLDEHQRTCPYEQLRPLLVELLQGQKDLESIKLYSHEQTKHIQTIENENRFLSELVSHVKLFAEKGKNDLQNELENQNKILEDLKTLRRKNEELMKTLDQQSLKIDELNSLKDQNRLLQEKLEQMKSIETKNDELTKICADWDLLKHENQRLREGLDQLKSIEEQFSQFSNQKLVEINQLEKEKQSLENQLRFANQQLVEINQLEKEKQSLENQLRFANQQLVEMNQLKNENQSLENRLRTKCQSYDQQIGEYLIKSQEDQLSIEKQSIMIKRMQNPSHPRENRVLFEGSSSSSSNGINGNSRIEEFLSKYPFNSLIHFNGEKISDHDMDVLITKGCAGKRCHSLLLWNNSLPEYSSLNLFFYLNHNRILTKLSIQKNPLSDVAIEALAKALAYDNRTLKELILASNEINDQRLYYLSDMLKSNQTLTVLGLQENQITDQGIQYFSQTLKQFNRTIEEIALYSNPAITDRSVNYINEILIHVQSLTTFWIWDCHLSDQGKEQIVRTKTNFDLKLSSNLN